MGNATDGQIVDFGVKRALHLGRGAAETDGKPVFGDLVDGEAVARQPVRDAGDIRFRGAEIGPHLLRGQPLVKVGRGRVVLVGHELVKGRLLRRVPAQHQDQVGHGERGAHPPNVVFGVRRRVRIPRERDKTAFVDPVDDPHFGGSELLGHRRRSTKHCAGQCTQGEQTSETHRNSWTLPGFRGPETRTSCATKPKCRE